MKIPDCDRPSICAEYKRGKVSPGGDASVSKLRTPEPKMAIASHASHQTLVQRAFFSIYFIAAKH
ncbi:hypothetical protein [Nostoc sp.]